MRPGAVASTEPSVAWLLVGTTKLPGLATGQTSPQGGSGGAALGGPKKPKPVVMRWICPRRSGPKWQERMRNRNSKSGKQMTTDASRLMRPEASAPGGTAPCGYMSVLPSGFTVVRGRLARWPVGQPASSIRLCWPYEGLSRNEGKLSSTVLRGGRAGNSPPPLGGC